MKIKNKVKKIGSILLIALMFTVLLSITSTANKIDNQIDPDEAMPHYELPFIIIDGEFYGDYYGPTGYYGEGGSGGGGGMYYIPADAVPPNEKP